MWGRMNIFCIVHNISIRHRIFNLSFHLDLDLGLTFILLLIFFTHRIGNFLCTLLFLESLLLSVYDISSSVILILLLCLLFSLLHRWWYLFLAAAEPPGITALLLIFILFLFRLWLGFGVLHRKTMLICNTVKNSSINSILLK